MIQGEYKLVVTREYRNPYTVIFDCKDAQALITYDNQSGKWEVFRRYDTLRGRD